MNFNIYVFYKFNTICVIKKNRIKNLQNKLSIQWQIILMNEGSFTKTLHYLTNNIIKTKTLQKQYSIPEIMSRNIRCAWLETEIYTQLTFARSLWRFLLNNTIYKTISNNKAIGQLLIENQIDIYKDIHEIYYGYCKNLELQFKSIKPLWGRKYTLYYNKIFFVTIQEFFSPSIADFFNNNNG